MKNNLLTKALLAFALLCSTLAQATQLNGAYTIDASATATTTSFKNFASAITYMTSTSTRTDGGPANTGTVGVSGPVTFNVAAGTYTVTTAISVPVVTGASRVNTITFEGGDGNVATRIITGTVNTSAIFIINQAQFIRVRNLTIRNMSSSNCGGVVIVGNTATPSGGGIAGG